MLALTDNPPELVLNLHGDLFVTPPDSDVGPIPVLTSSLAQHISWFVAETKSRQEKAVARALLDAGRSYFLPYLSHKTPSRNRVFTPLLPGFVFVAASPLNSDGEANGRSIVRGTKGVWNTIHTKSQQQLRRDLVALATRGAQLEEVHETLGLSNGLEVIITEGDLKGQTGTIVGEDKDGRIRVQLSLSVLGQFISVPVSPGHLRPVN